MKIGKKYFTIASHIPTNRKLIQTISEYIDITSRIESEWEVDEVWFRGVCNVNYKLIPRIYRTEVWEYDDIRFEWAAEEFATRAHAFIEHPHAFSKWHWHQMMQHYGMPTRLLDWTTGSLIALYFAVRELKKVHIPSVYLLDPFWLDEVAHNGQGLVYGTIPCFAEDFDVNVTTAFLSHRKELPDYPIGIQPPHVDTRITSQKSVFTIHGKLKHGFEHLCKRENRPHLLKLRFSTVNALQFKEDLRVMGITEGTLFPDLEGLAREIKWNYGMW